MCVCVFSRSRELLYISPTSSAVLEIMQNITSDKMEILIYSVFKNHFEFHYFMIECQEEKNETEITFNHLQSFSYFQMPNS